MKKIYLILLTFNLTLIGFSQSPIATIDRANITGPTVTGTTANISAIGFTRGPGITSNNSTNFSTKSWNAGSLVAAQADSEYIQWSISANSNYNIDVSSLDIRLLRNNNGPQNWQIFYSLDGFATAGLPVSAAQTVNTIATDYNLNSLVLNSGNSGTITFRLYAWNANNPGGTFTIEDQSAWAAFGVTVPGARISGIVNSIPLNSAESNIITTGFNPTDNINYLSYNVASGLSTTNAIKIGEFLIQDGGDDFTDTDVLPTILTDISYNITGAPNIAALAIFDGTNNLSETSIVSSNTTFNSINSGLGITAPDGGTKTFSVYATFKNVVVDNEQLQLNVSAAFANGIAGSSFETADAGGASTSILGDDNRIEVTRSQLVFGQEPSDVSQFEIMTPAPTVLGVDINSNLDLDYNGFILVGSALAFDASSTIFVAASSGVAIFDNLVFSEQGTDFLTATAVEPGIGFAISNSFTVTSPPLITLALQDFDGGLPDWSYTTDIAFFDNGWGTDGYYGIINSALASPIDNASFSDNILGSNDLNDEGGGTPGLATVTFSTIDIRAFNNIILSFDFDIRGYTTNDDAQYEVFYDGISQGIIDLVNGNSDIQGSVNIAVPDVVNTISLQVSIGNNGETAFTGFDNFKLATDFDGLIYFSNAWSPSAPTNGTGSLNALVLNGTYMVTSDVAINNLIIVEEANMIVDSGKSIQVNGDLFCDNNVLLDSNSLEYSSLIVNGNVFGNIFYSRHVNTNASVGGNDLISSPVLSIENFEEFAGNNINIFSNPSNPSEKLFGPFDKNTGLYLTYDTNVPSEADSTIDSGIGYRAASSDGLNFNFNGSVVSTDVTVPIVISGPFSPEWNLVGNPYPSYIKLSDFLAANNSQFDPVSSGIYGYDGDASDGWQIWNQAYSDANPDAVITPGQGFLVTSATTSGTILFTPLMRTTGTSDDFIPGRMQNPNISHLALKLENSNNKKFKTDFYFTDNASLGLDPGYDSETFSGLTPQLSIYSQLVEDNTGINMGVQSIGNLNLADVTIPLGVNAIQGEQVTISILETTLPQSTDIFLEDNVTNTFTQLTTSDYVFTPSSNIQGIGRFFLRFTENSLSVNDLNVQNVLLIYATVSPKKLFVKGNLTEKSTVKIFDLQGRLILTSNLDSGSNNNQIDVSNLKAGIYSVSVSNDSMVKTKKIILK